MELGRLKSASRVSRHSSASPACPIPAACLQELPFTRALRHAARRFRNGRCISCRVGEDEKGKGENGGPAKRRDEASWRGTAAEAKRRRRHDITRGSHEAWRRTRGTRESCEGTGNRCEGSGRAATQDCLDWGYPQEGAARWRRQAGARKTAASTANFARRADSSESLERPRWT